MKRLVSLGLACAFVLTTPMVSVSADVAILGDDAYHLSAGDKLRITIYNEPNFTGPYEISAAGNVSFPLIGDIKAKGGTVEDLQKVIHDRLADGNYIKDARVNVEVVNYRPYYILGEVNKPGEYPYAVGLKVQQAVAAAGGYTYRANRGSVFLQRADDGKEHSIKTRDQAVRVMPGDTIRIGERYL